MTTTSSPPNVFLIRARDHRQTPSPSPFDVYRSKQKDHHHHTLSSSSKCVSFLFVRIIISSLYSLSFQSPSSIHVLQLSCYTQLPVFYTPTFVYALFSTPTSIITPLLFYNTLIWFCITTAVLRAREYKTWRKVCDFTKYRIYVYDKMVTWSPRRTVPSTSGERLRPKMGDVL